jgi:ATP-dependent Lhr-like helicase
VEVSPRAARVLETLRRDGAMFFDELSHDARLLPVELENTLGELVATGLVNADSYAGLRAMLVPANKRASNDKRRRGAGPTMEEAGRWALVRRGDNLSITVRPVETGLSPSAGADAVASAATVTARGAVATPRRAGP